MQWLLCWSQGPTSYRNRGRPPREAIGIHSQASSNLFRLSSIHCSTVLSSKSCSDVDGSLHSPRPYYCDGMSTMGELKALPSLLIG